MIILSKSGKTTAYAEDYEQHLIDHGIYPVVHEHPDARPTPKPSNLYNFNLIHLCGWMPSFLENPSLFLNLDKDGGGR